jgi:dienelactone hydrolase
VFSGSDIGHELCILIGMPIVERSEVVVDGGDVELAGVLTLPRGSNAVVVFVHGSQGSRSSPRNVYLADRLHENGIGSLLFDRAPIEEREEEVDGAHFQGLRLARRLVRTLDWLSGEPRVFGKRFGLFGAGSGSGIAMIAAAERPLLIHAVVSRGGEPDLAGDWLERVLAPTLFIVGANDAPALGWNQRAGERMRSPHELQIVLGASHLFTEPGKLEEVADLATQWFTTYLRPDQPVEAPPPDPKQPSYVRTRPDPRY